MNGPPAAPKCGCRRWVISVQKTLDSGQLERQFRRAIQSIAADEYERIPKFRFKDDALQSLIGRLLLRQATRLLSDVEWHEITFGRTEHGKPFVVAPEDFKYSLNISHQGDLVAFASSCGKAVGVDCMRLDKDRNNKTADEYITSVAKSASPEEMRMMRTQPTDQMKMIMFYRYWSLKESICKATGLGIPNDLTSLDFRVSQSDRYRPGCFLTSTTALEHGVKQEQWIFEESFIGTDHCAAVCREKKAPRDCLYSIDPDGGKIFFTHLDLERLLEGSTVLNAMDMDGAQEWEDFNEKPRKPF